MPTDQNEQLDRLERSLRLFLKRPVRTRREARVTAAKLEAYVTALQEYDTTKQALAAKPDDSEMIEMVRVAAEVLDRARDELKRRTENQTRRRPA